MTISKYFRDTNHTGKALVLGNEVSTDYLHPAAYFSLEHDRVKDGFLRGLDDEVRESFEDGGIIVAGTNFGCGSSREVYAKAMAYNGVAAVIAKSTARICYRNLVNNGILIIDGSNLADIISTGDETKIDLAEQNIIVPSKDLVIRAPIDKKLLERLYENSNKKWGDYNAI